MRNARKTPDRRETDMKILIINGSNILDEETFYTEIDRVFTKNLNWQTGHNLDALNDLLRGGFGVFDYYEPIDVNWKNFHLSRKSLSKEFLDHVIEIFKSHEHLNLNLE